MPVRMDIRAETIKSVVEKHKLSCTVAQILCEIFDDEQRIDKVVDIAGKWVKQLANQIGKKTSPTVNSIEDRAKRLLCIAFTGIAFTSTISPKEARRTLLDLGLTVPSALANQDLLNCLIGCHLVLWGNGQASRSFQRKKW